MNSFVLAHVPALGGDLQVRDLSATDKPWFTFTNPKGALFWARAVRGTKVASFYVAPIDESLLNRVRTEELAVEDVWALARAPARLLMIDIDRPYLLDCQGTPEESLF